MDLTMYYQKIREMEGTIAAPCVVVISNGTGDGGKGGVPVEVARHLAAKMVVDGSARLASAEEAASYHAQQEAALKAARAAAAETRVAVTMVPSGDWKKLNDDMTRLKSGLKPAKE